MERSTKLIGGCVLALFISACSMTADKPFQQVTVYSSGNDAPTQMCASFSLTDEQAEQFLNRARVVSPQELHDHYSFLPCFVSGAAQMFGDAGQACDFTIRAGGTAQVSCASGDDLLLVCDTCEHLLSGGATVSAQ